MVILIDIDDTIEELCKPWCEAINKQYGTSVSYEDINEWDMRKFFPTLTMEQITSPLKDETFWDNVLPKDGAAEYILKLMQDGHEIYLCSATNYQNIKPKFDRVISRYFPYISWQNIIILNKKQMINADILVDDAIHNLEGGDYVKILMTAPHNRRYDAKKNKMIRVNNWKEAYDKITVVSKLSDWLDNNMTAENEV